MQYAHHVDANWAISYALGCVRVQVWRDDVDNARDVARRIREGEFKAQLLEMFGDLDDPCCPVCGSMDFRVRRRILQTAFAVVVVVLIAIPMPPDSSKRICRNCGPAWDA